MENIVCSNCGASLKESTDFCDSCGEWQGVSLTKEKSSIAVINKTNPVKTVTAPITVKLVLSLPIST